MRCAHIVDGVVANCCEIDENDLSNWPGYIPAIDDGNVGDIWDGVNFVTPPPPVVPPPPVEVTTDQTRLALAGLGLTPEQIDTFILQASKL